MHYCNIHVSVPQKNQPMRMWRTPLFVFTLIKRLQIAIYLQLQLKIQTTISHLLSLKHISLKNKNPTAARWDLGIFGKLHFCIQ